MRYFRLEDYEKHIFAWIRQMVYVDAQKPYYERERNGIEQLEYVLDSVSNDTYYPNAHAKGAYLFLSLSTGHHFSNGNKRLGFASAIHFFLENGYEVSKTHEITYQEWFEKYFPNYIPEENTYHRVAGWAIMNFNLAINIKEDGHSQRHSYNFNELKEIAEEFFGLMFTK